jgi:hypothetical protein
MIADEEERDVRSANEDEMKARDRLIFIAIGLFAIVAGFAKAHQAGPFGHVDFRGQQLFPGSAVGIGILFLLLACVPGSLIAKLVKRKPKHGKD